jgi:hypothetical protein
LQDEAPFVTAKLFVVSDKIELYLAALFATAVFKRSLQKLPSLKFDEV